MKAHLGLIALLAIGCSAPNKPEAPHDDHHDEPQALHLDQEQREIGKIETVEVKESALQSSITANGTVTSTTNGRALVTPPVAGRVVAIHVRPGESIKVGQLLATIESSDLALSWSAVAEAQRARDAVIASQQEAASEVSLAAARVSSAKASLARQQELAKIGAFSQAPLQQAQTELNEAQSELLSIQKEQVIHTESFRRLENLYKDGIVSRSDVETARLELQQDQIKLDRVKLRLTAAKSTYDREKNIANRGLLNAKELQSAEAEVKTATLELERAKVRQRSLANSLVSANRAVGNAQRTYAANGSGAKTSGSTVNLVAPIAGVLSKMDVTKGQAVDRTQSLMEIVNLNSVWVTVHVSEHDIALVRRGSSVQVKASAFPDQVFAGIVDVIGNQVDAKSRSIPVQCLVESQGKLKQDMFAAVELTTEGKRSVPCVPASAIVTEGQESFVFLETEDEFRRVPVKTGRKIGNQVEIIQGVRVGDKVAAKGVFVLKSESKKDELKGHED